MRRPDSYLLPNISGIFGCLFPCGVIGTVFALLVLSRWSRGDTAGAEKASRIAGPLGAVNLVGALVVTPVVALIFFHFREAVAAGTV